MDKTFLEQLKNHVQAIENAETGKDGNEKLLITIKLLLRQIDSSETCLAGYEKMEMKQFFSTFGKVAQAAYDFYQTSKGHLDPEILNGKIGRDLETAAQEVARVNTLLESIEKNDAELLKKQKELTKINEIYEEKRVTVAKLKEIKETVSDDVLKELDNEKAELNRTVKENQKIKGELEREIKELEDTDRSLSKTVAKANDKKKSIEENIIYTIEAKSAMVEKIFTDYSKDLNRLKEEIEGYKKKFEQLDDDILKIREMHESWYEFYSLHLGENSKVARKLKEYKISSADRLSDEIDELCRSVKSDLDRFDGVLRGVIREQEEFKEETGRRAGLSS